MARRRDRGRRGQAWRNVRLALLLAALALAMYVAFFLARGLAG